MNFTIKFCLRFFELSFNTQNKVRLNFFWGQLRMAKSALPDAEEVQKWISIILTLPGRLLDHVFITARIPDTPATANLRLFCLFVLSVLLLAICFKYRRSLFAWLIGLYALLLTIVSTFQIVSVIWTFLFPPTIEVSGSINVYRKDLSKTTGSVSGEWISNDCGARENVEVKKCNQDGRPLSPPYTVRIKSANCGSTVENVRVDTSNPTCLLVQERRQGCGYDNILGIRNCKGRGWLDYEINGSVESFTTALLSSQEIKTNFKGFSGGDIPINGINDINKDNIIVNYSLKLKLPGDNAVVLSNVSPSSSSFRSDVSGGKIVVQQSSDGIKPNKN